MIEFTSNESGYCRILINPADIIAVMERQTTLQHDGYVLIRTREGCEYKVMDSYDTVRKALNVPSR